MFGLIRLRFLKLCSMFQTSSISGSVAEQNLSDSLALLHEQGLDRVLASWLLESLQIRLSSSVVPEFWSGLKQPENSLEERGKTWVLLTAFRTLLDQLQPFLSMWGLVELTSGLFLLL